MTDHPAPEPFDAELADELLCAQLDGEFDAAARDLGLDAVEASQRLAATPGSEERRAALAAARDRLRADATPLDDLTRERLVRAALPSAANSTRSRRYAVLGGAAAALVAVAGVVAVVRGGSNGANRAATKATVAQESTPQQADTAARLPLPDFGAIDDATALAQHLARTALPAPTSSARSADGFAANGPTTLASKSGGAAAPTAALDAAAAQGCLGTLPGPAGIRDTTVVGTATYRGTGVFVAIGHLDGSTYAWLFRAADCAVQLTFSST